MERLGDAGWRTQQNRRRPYPTLSRSLRKDWEPENHVLNKVGILSTQRGVPRSQQPKPESRS
jgi:hypothetical protein